MPGYPNYAPDFAVKMTGLTLALDARQAVRSLTYDNNIDTADMFSLQLNNAGLQFTDSPLFDVGKTVEIHMGYVGELEPMILGEITAIHPSFPESGAPMLAVTGYDKSHRMRHNSPSSRTFNYVNDSLVAAQIAGENLLIPIVDPAPLPRESITQTGSDWSLLKQLADRNFFRLYVRWDKLYFHFPRPQTQMVVLEWGQNLSSFSPRLSTSGQVGIEIIRGYDYELAQTIVMVLPVLALGSDLDALIERLGSSFVDQLVKLGRHVVRGKTVTNYFDAVALAKAILQQILDGLYEGSGNCIGIPTLRAGDTVEIRGVGKRFSGKYTLSKVTHTIDESGYRTTFEVTQRATGSLLQSLRAKIDESPSPNRQEPLPGVLVGIVRQNIDLKGLGRVQVSFPDYSETNLSQWARIATFMAGGNLTEGWGGYFLPDIGDEVLVVFEHGDINRPVIVGALWNGTARPPQKNEGLNAKKVIKTKSGMQVLFDETPGLESITIEDKGGAKIQMDSPSGGIKIEHPFGSSIELKADGSVSISAKGNLDLATTAGDISLSAINVKVSVKGTMDVS